MSADSPEALVIDGNGLRFGIVAARFNKRYVDALLERVLRTLDEYSVQPEDVETIRVPGSFELPYVVNMLAAREEFDCIIALGVVIAGATSHHELIGHTTAKAFIDISRQSQIPVINGILTVNTEEQAEERSLGALDRGREFAQAAVEMADLGRRLSQQLEEAFGLDGAEQWPFLFDEDDDDEDDDEDQPWKS